MGDRSKIAWTEATWNPIRGTLGRWHCTKVSAGCVNCYAERMNIRFGGPKYTPNADMLQLNETTLTQPRRWKRPRLVFVESMSDLFHEDVPCEWIDRIIGAMLQAPHHTYQILTKRAERMRDYFNSPAHAAGLAIAGAAFPVPNVWLGVTVENQRTADERIPPLLKTPAAVRWLSMEPLLEEVRLNRVDLCYRAIPGIAWVVVGAESGPKARPMDTDWVRTIRDQCVPAGVPFFFKQQIVNGRKVEVPELDGHTWEEYPPCS